MRAIVILTLLSAVAEAQNPGAVPPRDQTVFGMEGVPVSNPVDLTNSALQVLRKNKFILSCLEDNQSPQDIPASWFVGSEIQLAGAKEVALMPPSLSRLGALKSQTSHVQPTDKCIDDPAHVIVRNQLFQGDRKEGCLGPAFALHIAHKKDALAFTKALLIYFRTLNRIS
jgi:hypothetical protein